MAEIARTRVELVWDYGGPGVCTYHWSKGTATGDWDAIAQDFHDELAAMFAAVDGYMVSALTWTVSPDIDIIEVETGYLIDQFTLPDTPPTGTGGNTGKAVSRAQQFCVNLGTDIFFEGKRLRGRTFLGPVGNDVVTANSTVGSSDRTVVEGAFAAMTSGVGSRLAVYHRANPSTHTGGYYGDVVSVRLKDVLGTLTSRRS
jgi:hypothetical protein